MDVRLDCLHITEQQVRQGVLNNIDYLRQVNSGEVWNKRHDAFFNAHLNGHIMLEVSQLINVEISTCIFSFANDKINLMLKMLHDEFGNQALYNFMVLLPEVCIRIFMDVHGMSYGEVTAYIHHQVMHVPVLHWD